LCGVLQVLGDRVQAVRKELAQQVEFVMRQKPRVMCCEPSLQEQDELGRRNDQFRHDTKVVHEYAPRPSWIFWEKPALPHEPKLSAK